MRKNKKAEWLKKNGGRYECPNKKLNFKMPEHKNRQQNKNRELLSPLKVIKK
jgi:hypothetical protein